MFSPQSGAWAIFFSEPGGVCAGSGSGSWGYCLVGSCCVGRIGVRVVYLAKVDFFGLLPLRQNKQSRPGTQRHKKERAAIGFALLLS